MRAFEPTPDQARAIRHPAADACVVAGAGSGKTAVLTQRFLHLVEAHGLPVRRIAALTFTEKAAGEMKERIARALEAAGRSEDRDDVEFAAISTIHAFCARLLRLHAVDAGVDPAFRLLDEVEALLLREDALERTRARIEAEGGDAADVLARVAASPEELVKLLEAIRSSGTPLDELVWARGTQDVATATADVERAAADLLQEVSAKDPQLDALAQEVVEEIRNALAPGDDLAWRVDAVALRPDDVRPPTGRGPLPVQRARKALREALEALRATALDDLAAREIAPPLLAFLGALEGTYAQLKDERNALDFTDLELRALALLERLAREGRRPAHAPAALLVDEYQDTNPLQARILAHLRAGCPLFAVGDPKQSIYRFRGADVRVIQREVEDVGEGGRHRLQATFRSSPSLVACLNALNEAIFRDGAAGVEHAPLVASGSFSPTSEPDVELRVLDVGAGTPAPVGREAQAHAVAAWIQDQVQRGVPRTKASDGRGGEGDEARPLCYGDVAVLVRARNMIPTLESALHQAGVPFLTYKGRGFFQAEEVADLLHVLRVVQDPADDFALACLLTGPLAAATDEELLGVFAEREGGSARPGGAWLALGEAARTHARLGRLVDGLERLRREALAGHLGRVVEGVLYDLGLMEAALLQDDGRRRAANLRKALVLARDLEREGRHDLGDLLRHLARVRDREVAEAEAAIGQEGEDVVRINTVHSAKGLEYPVVVLADIQRGAPSARGGARFDGESRWAVKVRHPLEGSSHASAGFARLVEEDKERQAEEDRRLLYVAMTRAEERLLLVGHCPGVRKKDGRPNYFSGWGDILLDAVGGAVDRQEQLVDHGDGGRLRTLMSDPPAAPPQPDARAYVPATAEAREEAARLLEAARRDVAPLGQTPFVATVTDLLGFSASPAAFYARGLEPRDLPPMRTSAEPEDPAAGQEHAAPDAERDVVRRQLFDETHERGAPSVVDRAGLGRALHAAVERLPPDGGDLAAAELDRLVEREVSEDAQDKARELLHTMLQRFRASATGRRMAEALAHGEDLRREVAFHARVRFPAGTPVGPYDSLLVRGAIDLWVPEPDGLWIVDLKTNRRTDAHPTPEAWRDHYAEQLRLYALAAERILGSDVAGARIVLVDPSWGTAEVPEVEVDVSGAALEDTRRLCRAYAVASLEGRWPERWQDLLD